jgi:hypothetical protein
MRIDPKSRHFRRSGLSRSTVILVVAVTAIGVGLMTYFFLAGRNELRRHGVPVDWVSGPPKLQPYWWQPSPALKQGGDADRRIEPDGKRPGEHQERSAPRNEGVVSTAPMKVGRFEDEQKQTQNYCRDTASPNDSDLCAQWAAGREVAIGNGIARSNLVFQQFSLVISLFLGVLGVLGLVIAARAAELAARAVDDAATASRAYFELSLRPLGQGFALHVANIGAGPGVLLEALVSGTETAPVTSVGEPVACMAIIAAGKAEPALLEVDAAPWFAATVRYRDAFGHVHRSVSVFERTDRGFALRNHEDMEDERGDRRWPWLHNRSPEVSGGGANAS